MSSLRHVLYSQKKGQMLIKEYLPKIKAMSDSLTTVGSAVSEQEHVSIVLIGLSIDFELVRMVASATNLSLYLLTEILLDCEAQQGEFLVNVPMQANLTSKTR